MRKRESEYFQEMEEIREMFRNGEINADTLATRTRAGQRIKSGLGLLFVCKNRQSSRE